MVVLRRRAPLRRVRLRRVPSTAQPERAEPHGRPRSRTTPHPRARFGRYLALNPNEASNTLTFTGDFILPTANITSTAPTYTNVAPIPVKIEWSEDTTGFVSGDVSISGGALSSLSKIGVDYNGTITPAAEGNITLQVPADVCTDIATNPNLASESLMFVYDVTRPSTTASTEEAAKTNKQSIGCKVTFSEPVPDFTAAAVQLGGVGGSVSEFAQGLEGDHVYTFNVSASQEGNVTVFVNAGNTYSPRITDRADNDILASNTLNFLYDTTFPAVTLTLLSELSALDSLSTKNKPIQVQMDTSEPIDGFKPWRAGGPCGRPTFRIEK